MPPEKKTPTRAIKLESAEGEIPAVGKSWFFGIGINEYKHFSTLNNAVGDVKAIQDVLQRKYRLDESRTLFNQEATRRNIFKELKYLLEHVGSDDKLFVLFSGHGYFSKTQEGFWVPHEAEPEFDDDFLPNFHLKHYLEHIRARHILVVSDSCFSGSLFAEGTTRKYTGPEERLEGKKSRYGICSGRDNEEVWDGPSGGHSPFAESIIEFLEENQDLRFRASLLAETVLNRTTAAYRQTPRHGQLFGVGDKGGQYVFRLREVMPEWKRFWQEVQQYPESHLQDLHAKIVQVDEYIDQYPQATNLPEAYQLGEFLEQKRAFFLAKGSMFRLKQLSRKQTPFQEEAKKLLLEFKAGYQRPEEDQQIELLVAKQKKGEKENRTQPSFDSFTDPRDGQTYQTVELNGLVWMAENLNFNIGEGSHHYEDDSSKAKEYGRLYTWDAAKKACPTGWRLPTIQEWKDLKNSIGSNQNTYHVLIKSGQNGFNAILGGKGSINKIDDEIDEKGYYWTSTEKGVNKAANFGFKVSSKSCFDHTDNKEYYFSCRCIKITSKELVQTEILKTSQAQNVPSTKANLYQTFTDPRDNQVYRTIELNGLRWMAKNLNFDLWEGCWFYENDAKHGEKYGRLYTWDAAKKACPRSWRLPTDEEWKNLAKSFGGYYDFDIKKDVGDPKKGYAALMEGGRSGLSTQLGGYLGFSGSFSNLGSDGYYWSATEFSSDFSWLYGFHRSKQIQRSINFKSVGLSCRCVQDLTI